MNIIKLAIPLFISAFCITLGTGTFISHNPTKFTQSELSCLATNIYHEARSEPIEGQLAVAQVTINRVKDKRRFASTVCGVVFERAQFSWTLTKRKQILDAKAWKTAVEVAKVVLSRSQVLPEFNALFYHTTKVSPRWSKQKRVLAIIGKHVFYL
jgi:spore germination cell wall hydrolase CwlJ-like protein